MDWKFSGSKPVYQQIRNILRNAVISGKITPGSRIPPVRELALAARVNPNTMQRALTQLEGEGILVGSGTAGRYVTTDRVILDRLHRQVLEETVASCAMQFRALGLSPAEAAALLARYEEKEEDTWTEF